MVREQTCSCCHKVDQSLWQTPGTFDLIHPSHKWIQTMLSCGKHNRTMQIRIVSGLWFCRRPWRLKINIRWTLVHFRKSYICSNKLDVQETDFSFTQLNRSWIYFSRCRSTHGWNCSSWSLGFGCRSVSLFPKPWTTAKIKYEETLCVTPHQTSTPKTKPRFQPSTTILIWVMLKMFRPTWHPLHLVLWYMSLRTMKPWLWW